MATKDEEEGSAVQALLNAVDKYAAVTGDRVTIKIRPQRGTGRARHDIDVNSPELLKLKAQHDAAKGKGR